MHKNAWWKHIGERTPEIPPDTFSDVDFFSFTDFQSAIGQTVFYHFLLGKTISLLFKTDILGAYYFCRLVSILFLLTSLLLCLDIFRKLPFNENLLGDNLVWGALFVLFLPQFLILSVSVNPDSLSILLGTLFFYAAYHLMAERLKVFPIFLCVLCAVIGLFTDKSLFFLILLGLLLPFFLIRGKKVLRSISFVFLVFFLFVLVASWIAWYFPAQIYSTMSLINVRMLDKIQIIPQLFTLDEFNREFLAYLIDSSFLKFGWMAYSADRLFYWVWRISLFLSFLGVIIFLGRYAYSRIKRYRLRSYDSPIFRVVMFSLIAVFTQILNVRIYQGTKFILPQGRYLFPLILPIAFIFILGLKSFFGLFHKKAGQVAVALFVVFQFFFFTYVVWNYLIPVFHLTVKSPHPGL